MNPLCYFKILLPHKGLAALNFVSCGCGHIVLSIRLFSAVNDNVPSVAAILGMNDLTTYPQNAYFCEFLAYCSGTGGSTLIIGSAAGIGAMGTEKIELFWYVKKIGWLAFIGYLAGAFVCFGQRAIF